MTKDELLEFPINDDLTEYVSYQKNNLYSDKRVNYSLRLISVWLSWLDEDLVLPTLQGITEASHRAGLLTFHGKKITRALVAYYFDAYDRDWTDYQWGNVDKGIPSSTLFWEHWGDKADRYKSCGGLYRWRQQG